MLSVGCTYVRVSPKFHFASNILTIYNLQFVFFFLRVLSLNKKMKTN